jgi:hypothetical protein
LLVNTSGDSDDEDDDDDDDDEEEEEEEEDVLAFASDTPTQKVTDMSTDACARSNQSLGLSVEPTNVHSAQQSRKIKRQHACKDRI